MTIYEQIKAEQAAETCPCGRLSQHNNDLCGLCEQAIAHANERAAK